MKKSNLNEHAPERQIPMDEPLRRQRLHPCGNLGHDGDLVPHGDVVLDILDDLLERNAETAALVQRIGSGVYNDRGATDSRCPRTPSEQTQ